MIEENDRNAGGAAERAALTRRLNVHYALLQAFFWMTYVTLGNFTARILKDRGMSTTLIGLVISSAAILSMYVETMLGRLSDRKKGFSPRRVSFAVWFLTALLAGLAYFLPHHNTVLTFLLFSLLLTGLYAVQPFVTSMAYQYINRGIPVNFGLARGTGSFTCAFVSAASGFLIAATSSESMDANQSAPFRIIWQMLA